MIQEYISRQDMIVITAIDIINDSGLSGLTFKNLAYKANMTEDLLYKYYGDVNDVLVDVVKYYFEFDERLIKTINSKDMTYIEKINMYVEQFAQYYDGYPAISVLMLQYEELLHNSATREIVTTGTTRRRVFVADMFQGAIDNGELNTDLTAEDLCEVLTGHMIILTLNRRFMPYTKSYSICLKEFTEKLFSVLT